MEIWDQKLKTAATRLNEGVPSPMSIKSMGYPSLSLRSAVPTAASSGRNNKVKGAQPEGCATWMSIPPSLH